MPTLSPTTDVVASRPDRLERRVRSICASGIRRFFALAQTLDDVISPGVGEPDFTTPAHMRDAAVTSLQKGLPGYTSNWGRIEPRRLLSEHLDPHCVGRHRARSGKHAS